MKKQIKIFDTTLRDGEQSPGCQLNTKEKITLAKALEESGICAELTIGNDKQVAAAVEQMGAKHKDCEASACVLDAENKIITTPAYMLAKNIAEVWEGVEKLVRAVVEMT